MAVTFGHSDISGQCRTKGLVGKFFCQVSMMNRAAVLAEWIANRATRASIRAKPRSRPWASPAAIENDRVFDLGIVLTARTLWEELGIGPGLRRRLEQAGLAAPHEAALFPFRPELEIRGLHVAA